jgi:hypothetical protein
MHVGNSLNFYGERKINGIFVFALHQISTPTNEKRLDSISWADMIRHLIQYKNKEG